MLALTTLCSACVAHPVGPARTFSKYEGKAATTAESALSWVQTTRLAAQAAAQDNAPSPYLQVVLSRSEEGLTRVQGTFDSIQPPGGRADDLRRQLDDLLTKALAHVADVRIAARRGAGRSLREVAQPLDDDAKALQDFVEANQR